MSIRFERILVPTDYSELSLHALHYARDLTDTFGAQTHCLHVVDSAGQYWSAMGPESVPIGPSAEELFGLAQKRMSDLKSGHMTGWKHEPITSVAIGSAFVEIIGYARANDIDLIVMATHGRGAISHVFLGSTTEKVVRKAPCAVLTVRAPGHDFKMP